MNPPLVSKSKGRRRKGISRPLSRKAIPVSRTKSKYDYGDDWEAKSYEIRKAAGWTCKSCGWRPRKPVNRKFLHAHHERSLSKQGSNARSNLGCECLGCHAKEHPHMRNLPAVKFFLENKHWL